MEAFDAGNAKNLKLAKYPPLPTSEQDLADFAAGMAMGVVLLNCLNSEMNKVFRLIVNYFWRG